MALVVLLSLVLLVSHGDGTSLGGLLPWGSSSGLEDAADYLAAGEDVEVRSRGSASAHLREAEEDGGGFGGSGRRGRRSRWGALFGRRAGSRRGGAGGPDADDDSEEAAYARARYAASRGVAPWGNNGTLRFSLCNGFANQRLSLMAGVVLAQELNRTMVLPKFVLNGTQETIEEVSEEGGAVEFGAAFDAEIFQTRMLEFGIPTVAEFPRGDGAETVVKLDGPMEEVVPKLHALRGRKNLRIDCPGFRLLPEYYLAHREAVLAALEAIRPAPAFAAVVDKAVDQLRSRVPRRVFNVLHLRAEHDWISHCERWTLLEGDNQRDNCMNNTDTVGEQLKLHRVDPAIPLLVVTSYEQASRPHLDAALANLRSLNFQVVPRTEIATIERKHGREEAALIDYYISLQSEQFMGNSVSTFSAMLILERRQLKRFAGYYNGGNIPLECFVPLYRLPWVFTFNDWSTGTVYEGMARAAVNSAIYEAGMKPYCMFSGARNSSSYQWFQARGVAMLDHKPQWADAVALEASRNRDQNLQHSHLYGTAGTVVGTFQRVDIPILPELAEYDFVLFTDSDVFFRHHMSLVDWGSPLPKAAGMGYEMQDMFPYNAGIILMNRAYLAKTHDAFINWIIGQKNGLYFDNYGPLDQGAYNQYYESEIRGHPIKKIFNAKPYQAFDDAARIVHLHGPKPTDYLNWILTGECGLNFGTLCESGVKNGLCWYVADYAQWNLEWAELQMLSRLCAIKTAKKTPGQVQW